jgi:hypothetical protein
MAVPINEPNRAVLPLIKGDYYFILVECRPIFFDSLSGGLQKLNFIQLKILLL